MSTAKPPGQRRGHGDGGQRALVTTNHIDPAIQPPAHLGEVGRSVWSHVAQTATQWLQPSDLPTLLLLCEGYERRASLLDDINHRGAVIEELRFQGANQYSITIANPAVGMLEKLEGQITRWLSLLGLSPSDRGRLGLQQAQTETTLDRLRRGTGQSPASSSPSTKAPSRKRPSQPVTASES